MSLQGFRSKAIRDFRGAWTDLEQIEARANRAFVARNVRFPPLKVLTREGTSELFEVDDKVTGMHLYLSASANWLFFYENGDIKVRILDTDTTIALYSQAGRIMSVAEAGPRVYIATADADGNATGQARFVNEDIVGNPVDKAFAPPFTFIPVIADAGAGFCTAGAHRFGYLVTSRSGFPGKPSPAPANVFTPTSFTIAPGGREVQFTVTVDVTAPPVTIRPIMTTADNLEEYYIVPDESATIFVAGAGLPISMTISISDEDLALRGTSAEPNFNYLAQTVAGTGPFNPSRVINYGNRMVYVVGTKVYISDPFEYEVVTEDLNTQEIPGRKLIITGFQLRNTLYLLGPNWTAAFNDNGQAPRQWAAPYMVSGAIGTTAPNGVCWQTRGDYAWVANERGCWLFDGQYAEKPISYYIAEWADINWIDPGILQMADDVIRQRLYVAVPMAVEGDPTPSENTRMFVFDYSRGLTPETVDWSIDEFDAETFSSILFMYEKEQGKSTTLIGPSAAGSITKYDSAAANDFGDGVIDSEYETGFLLKEEDKKQPISRFGRIELRVKGSGTLSLTAYSEDRQKTFTMPSLSLTQSPGQDLRSDLDLTNENMSLRMRTNALNARFEVSMMRAYWRDYMRNR